MLEKTDGIIMDVDGTLWDSTGIVARAWTQAVQEEGFPDRHVTADDLRGEFGRPMDVIADDLLPDLTKEQRLEIMKACCDYEHRYLAADPCRICYPGVRETIRALSETVPLFIVSNCQAGYIELFLEKTDLGDCIRDFECFGNNGLTKPDNIRLLAQRNGLKTPFYVGDTQGDCDAAAEAGVPFVYAAYGFGTADRMDARIDRFSDLRALIENIKISGDKR